LGPALTRKKSGVSAGELRNSEGLREDKGKCLKIKREEKKANKGGSALKNIALDRAHGKGVSKKTKKKMREIKA